MDDFNCSESAIAKHYRLVSTPVLSSISVVSLVLNACNIAIFSRRKMVSPTNSILLAIAVSDLCKVSLFLLTNAARLPQSTSYGGQVLHVCCNVLMFLMHAFALWCGVLLALFRFFYLSFFASPLTKVWFSLARSRLAICLAFLANVLALAPYASVLRITGLPAAPNTTDDAAAPVAYMSEMLSQHEFDVRLFSSIAQKLLPCIIMALLSVCIIRSLRQTERRRESLANPRRYSTPATGQQKMSVDGGVGGTGGGGGGGRRRERRSRDHRRTTRFLLIIMLLYSLFEIPMGLLIILSDRTFELASVMCFTMTYNGILDTLGLMNNTVNFVLYCFMSKQFRDVFKEVFGLDRLVEKARKSMPRRPASAETSAGVSAAAAAAAAAVAAATSQQSDTIGLCAVAAAAAVDTGEEQSSSSASEACLKY